MIYLRIIDEVWLICIPFLEKAQREEIMDEILDEAGRRSKLHDLHVNVTWFPRTHFTDGFLPKTKPARHHAHM